eukprot:jgi/Galph1/1106/GphlegSOOS_G5905.1
MTRKRVCIIGGGASGVSAAWTLSQSSSKLFQVELWEISPRLGGVATTLELDGGLYLNDQVQGGTPSYRHTMLLLKELGFSPSFSHMRISFGTGQRQWNNLDKDTSPIIRKLESEIRRFGVVLRNLHFIPIDLLLKVLGFSTDFRNYVLYPLCSLFFGTGIQTPRVSSAVIASVFFDEDGKLFDYDSQRFLSQQPDVFAFPKLSLVYDTAAIKLEERGVQIFRNRSAKKIFRSKRGVLIEDDRGVRVPFDEVILCVDAETALSLLEVPRWLEKVVLGNVEYYYDTVITHEDADYIAKHYDTNAEKKEQYFVRVLEHDPQKVEMSFLLNNYQPQLKHEKRRIFQTIFPADKVDTKKILLSRVTKHNAHTWKHFALTVLWWRWIQGYQHTWFAGAYCLFNIHEVAIISGVAAAYRLGADYPFPVEEKAKKQFFSFLRLLHGQ